MYIQVSIHDYLRALMGFHQFDSTFTLDPRIADDHKNVSRGLGNQVTIEFNLLYRFHCAISGRDEKYTEDFLQEAKLGAGLNWPGRDGKPWDPKDITMEQFSELMRAGGKAPAKEPCDQEFGLHVDPKKKFARNKHTGLFDDQKMVEELIQSMDEPLGEFEPRSFANLFW